MKSSPKQLMQFLHNIYSIYFPGEILCEKYLANTIPHIKKRNLKEFFLSIIFNPEDMVEKGSLNPLVTLEQERR